MRWERFVGLRPILLRGDSDEVRGKSCRTSFEEGEKLPLGEMCDCAVFIVSWSSSVEPSRLCQAVDFASRALLAVLTVPFDVTLDLVVCLAGGRAGAVEFFLHAFRVMSSSESEVIQISPPRPLACSESSTQSASR